jgi:DNA-binding transcriptional MerR regulator
VALTIMGSATIHSNLEVERRSERVRIAELSQRTEVPVATIKYYLREGLLPAGTTTAPNQAQYDEHHVARLRLIRALREGAGLSIATLGRVLAAVESHQPDDRPAYLTLAVRALSEPLDVPEQEAADYDDARREVDALLNDLGWDTDRDSPGNDDLVRALVSLHRFAPAAINDPRQLRPYADAARSLATTEIPSTFDTDLDPDEALRFSVLGTVLFEPVLLALRKLAHVDRIRNVGRDRPPPEEDTRSRPGRRQRR